MNTSLKKESWPYTLVLFFLLPFALFIVALKKSNYSWAKNVVWAYIIFFGFTFVIYGTGSDSYQYWLDLKRMYDNNISFKELVSGFYYSSQNIDIFSSLLMFVVSKFTDSPKVLFAVFGFFFGFFYTRTIWLILHLNEYKFNLVHSFLMLCLALIVPFWYINGFRFWTASIIFIYSIVYFFYLKKHVKYIILLCLTPLMHFSFVFPLAIFFLYSFLGNRIYIYYILFVATVFISEFDISFFRDLSIQYFPQLLQERVSGYLDENYAKSLDDYIKTLNWYVEMHKKALEWFIIVVLSLIALNYQFLFSKLDKAKSYLSFILLFGAFGNILNTIPSGGRFMTLFSFFAISFIVIYYKNMYGFVKNSIVLGVPVILLFIIVSFRLGFDYVNIFALVGNPLTTLFLDNEISLMDLIK